MPFTVAALIDFLPRFIIAGIITYIFIAKFSKMAVLDYEKPEIFIAERRKLHSQLYGRIGSKLAGGKTSPATSGMVATYGPSVNDSYIMKVSLFGNDASGKRRHVFLREIELVLLGVDLWILISLALSPVSTVVYLFPPIRSISSALVYIIIAGTASLAVLGTVTSRVKFSKRNTTLLVLGTAGSAVAVYFLPSMSWINNTSLLFHITIIYSTVIIACVLAYIISSKMKRSTAFFTSAYSAIAVYGVSAILLFLNFMLNVLG